MRVCLDAKQQNIVLNEKEDVSSLDNNVEV